MTKHDRIVPASDYEELLRYKEIAEKMPCIKVIVETNTSNYKPYVKYYGDNAIKDIIDIGNGKFLEENKTVINLNKLVYKYYEDKLLKPQSDKVSNLERDVEILINDFHKFEASIENKVSIIKELNDKIKFLEQENSKLIQNNLQLKEDRTWFKKWIW